MTRAVRWRAPWPVDASAPNTAPAATTPAVRTAAICVPITVIRMSILRMIAERQQYVSRPSSARRASTSPGVRACPSPPSRWSCPARRAGACPRRPPSACASARASSATGPNVAAQALRLGASRAVALLVPDMTNPFFSRVLRGAQRAAAEAGYIVILVDTQNDRHWESQSFEALRAGPVDGYLLFEVTAPEALGPDENVVMMETEAPRPPVGPLRRRGGRGRRVRALRRAGAHAASATWRPPSARSPSRTARRARRRVLSDGRARPGRPAAGAHADLHRGRAR